MKKTPAPKCDKAPKGWACTRAAGHTGPCAASPEPAKPSARDKLKELGGKVASAAKATWNGFKAAVTRVWEIVAENVQGLVALLIAVGVFAGTPYLVATVWPGIADEGITSAPACLHAVSLVLVLFFVGVFASWASFQLDWKGFDKFTLAKDVAALIAEIKNPALKLCVIFAPYFLLLGWFAVSCWAVVSLLLK